MTMTPQEQIDWIRLLHTEGIGLITFYKLISKFTSPTRAINYLENRPTTTKKKLAIAPKSVAERDLELASALGAKVMFYNDEDYPRLLHQIPDAPAVLYILGNADALSQSSKTVAIVGSRNASINSKVLTEDVAANLASLGYTIVSGMALGIDAAAHIGAINAPTVPQEGRRTIAVLAGGVDNIYPQSNSNIYHKIIDSAGAVISEMPPRTAPQSNLFPRRNRIISGLSLGTVIMEASLKSGSLITARFALDQNREVLAVPNFPRDPRAGGTNQLIKNGATLIENAADIDAVLSRLTSDSYAKFPLFPEIREQSTSFQYSDESSSVNLDLEPRILSLLSHTPIPVNSLIRELSNYSESQITTALLNLELDDKISYPSTGNISLKF